MHMADALVSPATGLTLWGASAALIAYSSHKVNKEADDARVPLMGVTAAFVFAAQMINFAIPGTGSSGHLGGGLLLAALLGPHAGFLTMASVLTVQALLFADGGLLALGCNIFNLGFFPCFIAYPLIFRPLLDGHTGRGRLVTASLAAAVTGLLLGALAVVGQTVASGITELPFIKFTLVMLPIHLAIGLVEGGATAAVLLFIRQARPDIAGRSAANPMSYRKIVVGLLATALLTGGVASWFASNDPDGLEWAIEHASEGQQLSSPDSALHTTLSSAQEQTALLPDYDLGAGDQEGTVDAGTTLSGVVGALVTLLVAGLLAWLLKRRRRPESEAA